MVYHVLIVVMIFVKYVHKQNRLDLSFPKSTIKTSSCFELLHIDTWGPFKKFTHDGFNQFLTIVDNFSRHTWIFLMKHKSDVVKILEHFIAFIQTQFHSHVNCIRSDNAKEFCEGAILPIYQQHGIFHQRSYSDTPQ